MEQRSLVIDRPLDLRSTLRPLLGRFADDGWWYPTRSPDGPATLRVTRRGAELHGSAWGPGAGWVLGRLGAICGLEDHGVIETSHPVVRPLAHRLAGVRFGATGDVFAHLVDAITHQKVTRTEGDRAMRELGREFSEPAPGPRAGLILPPDPERLAVAPYWALHRCHLEERRARTLLAAAREHRRIGALAAAGAREAGRFLSLLPGIGPWTVAKTLTASHGDPDQVAVGDFHLKNLVSWHLAGRPRGSDEEMMDLLEEFTPQRGRVVRLLQTLGPAPRYGPRSMPRDITGV